MGLGGEVWRFEGIEGMIGELVGCGGDRGEGGAEGSSRDQRD